MNIRLLLLFLLLLTSCASSYSETSFEKERDKRIHNILRNFTQAMQKKGFHAAGIGEGLDHSNWKQNYLEVTFEIEKLPNVDFARKIEVTALQEFLHYINSEEGIQDYVAEYPFPLKFINIGFISLNENLDSEEELFLVANSRDEIYYSKHNPEKRIGRLIDVHRESYEDAVRILAEQEREAVSIP